MATMKCHRVVLKYRDTGDLVPIDFGWWLPGQCEEGVRNIRDAHKTEAYIVRHFAIRADEMNNGMVSKKLSETSGAIQ